MSSNPDGPLGPKFKAENNAQARLVSQFVEFSSEDSLTKGFDLISAIQEYMLPSQLIHLDKMKKLQSYGKVKEFLEPV